MHDVLAHSLSALAVQLEGARLLARSTGADPSVVEAVERSHHLARAGWTRRGARSRRCAAARCPGPTGSARSPTEFREQTGVDDRRWRSTASRASCRPRRGSPSTGPRRRRSPTSAATPTPSGSTCGCATRDDGTWLTVEDRGAPANGAAEPGLGYGLTGMRERAELLGGRLAAAPTADGFRVELFLPA